MEKMRGCKGVEELIGSIQAFQTCNYFPNTDDTVGKVLRFSGLETIPNGYMANDSGSV